MQFADLLEFFFLINWKPWKNNTSEQTLLQNIILLLD